VSLTPFILQQPLCPPFRPPIQTLQFWRLGNQEIVWKPPPLPFQTLGPRRFSSGLTVLVPDLPPPIPYLASPRWKGDRKCTCNYSLRERRRESSSPLAPSSSYYSDPERREVMEKGPDPSGLYQEDPGREKFWRAGQDTWTPL
jgi:hypothetical protein